MNSCAILIYAFRIGVPVTSWADLIKLVMGDSAGDSACLKTKGL